MIALHRYRRADAEFHLNPDLILTVEASPDTTISLTTGHKLVVRETVDEVVAAVRAWRAGIAADALGHSKPSRLAPVR